MKISITGGTDVAWAMPADYFREVVAPQLRRFASIDVTTEKRGYYPAGNGTVTVRIKPRVARNNFSTLDEFLAAVKKETIAPNLTEQGHLIHIKGISHASKSLEEARVAERQAHSAQQALAAQYKCPVNIRSEYAETPSPGSGITLWAVFSKKKDDIDVADPHILGADMLGEKGLPAEQVGKEAAQKLIAAIASGAAADAHLADNLIPWMALNPSAIHAKKITPHTLTNIEITKKFLPAQFSVQNNTIIASRA